MFAMFAGTDTYPLNKLRSALTNAQQLTDIHIPDVDANCLLPYDITTKLFDHVQAIYVQKPLHPLLFCTYGSGWGLIQSYPLYRRAFRFPLPGPRPFVSVDEVADVWVPSIINSIIYSTSMDVK